jgi:hypothetical protein
MGDCGNYSASVCVEFNLRKKGKNTEEECTEFLNKNKLEMTIGLEVTEENITDAFENGQRIVMESDWETWDSKNSDLDEMIDEINDDYILYSISDATIKDIEYMDLDLVKKYKIKEISSNLSHSINILSAYDSIYCDNDNSSYDSLDISKYAEIFALPGASLVLNADGNGNC